LDDALKPDTTTRGKKAGGNIDMSDDKLNELLVKCWRDVDTRKRFIANPKAVLAEHEIELPPAIEIVVVEDTVTKVHVVLPPMAATKPTAGLSDAELDAVSGGAGTSPGVSASVSKQQQASLQKVRALVIPTSPTQQTCDPKWTSPCAALSQRRHKKEIDYLSPNDEQRLADELMSFRLATYHYNHDDASEPRRLGFIIDDVVTPSAAIANDGEHVDLYGYTTMAVATLQVQQQQIATLQQQVDELKRALEENKR
jgi:hypothetical protein